MSRVRIIVLLLCALGFASWITLRPGPAAQATQSVAEYGDNSEEIALQRWQTNQARHWRYVVTRR